MRIAGTFLDEITHDIPSQNWGPREWAADFDVMRHVAECLPDDFGRVGFTAKIWPRSFRQIC